MLKRYLSFFSLLLISSFILSSCNYQVDQADLLDKKWILTEMDYDSEVLEPIEEIFIEFSENEATGSGGCNAFFGEYSLHGNEFKITGLGYTEMACEADIMEVENWFFELLPKSETIEISGNKLTIYCDGGELRFEH